MSVLSSHPMHNNSSLYKQLHALLFRKVTYLRRDRTTNTCEGEGRARHCFAAVPLDHKLLQFSVDSNMPKIELTIPGEVDTVLALLSELSFFLPSLLLQFVLFRITSEIFSFLSVSWNVCVYICCAFKNCKMQLKNHVIKDAKDIVALSPSFLFSF